MTNTFENQYSCLLLVLHVERTHELQEVWRLLQLFWCKESYNFNVITLDIVSFIKVAFVSTRLLVPVVYLSYVVED